MNLGIKAAEAFRLQVQYSVSDFLGTALVPELGTDIATGTSCNVKHSLVAVATLGAFPDELAIVFDDLNFTIVSAAAAIIRLGVQFGVHDVIIDKLQNAHDCLEVILNVGNFDITDRAARRKLLKFALKFELGESVNLFGNMDMIAVGDITTVGDARDDSKALLEAAGKFIGRRLKGSAVQ